MSLKIFRGGEDNSGMPCLIIVDCPDDGEKDSEGDDRPWDISEYLEEAVFQPYPVTPTQEMSGVHAQMLLDLKEYLKNTPEDQIKFSS